MMTEVNNIYWLCFLEANRKFMQKWHLWVQPFSLKDMQNMSKYMGWETYSSDPKIALITNSFGDLLPNNHKKVQGKNLHP